jgi:hypothetical protein
MLGFVMGVAAAVAVAFFGYMFLKKFFGGPNSF